MFTLFFFYLWIFLLLLVSVPMLDITEGCRQGERTKKRSKDNFKTHCALGQSSCGPPGKSHMPWEQETRANPAAAVHFALCFVFVCVCVCTYSHARGEYLRV